MSPARSKELNIVRFGRISVKNTVEASHVHQHVRRPAKWSGWMCSSYGGTDLSLSRICSGNSSSARQWFRNLFHYTYTSSFFLRTRRMLPPATLATSSSLHCSSFSSSNMRFGYRDTSSKPSGVLRKTMTVILGMETN